MPASIPFGGAERRFAYLFVQLQRMKQNVCLITNESAHQKLESVIPEIKEFQDNIYYPQSYSFTGSSLLKKIKLLQTIFFIKTIIYLLRESIHHIHFPVNPSGYTFLMSLLARWFGITISCSVVNSLKKEKSDFSWIQYRLWKGVLNRCKWIDFLSPSIQKNMLHIFGSNQPLFNCATISPCSFSYAADMLFAQLNTNPNPSPPKNIDVLFLSRFIKGKGIDLLLNAIKILDDKKLPYKFYIAGFGPLEQEIKATTENLSHVNCEISYASNPIEILQRSKIVLSIQQYENYPSQTLLEASACETAVIATDVGDTRMICNESNSLLIKNEGLMLANAIELLLVSDSLRMGLSKKLREDVMKGHSVKKFAEYYIQNTCLRTDETLT